MKKFYVLFVLLFAASLSFAQIKFVNLGDAKWQISYVDAPQWATYDPQGASTIYLHTWINSAENSTVNAYSDDWNGSTVSLTWDPNFVNASGANGAFVGTVDLAVHNFNSYGGVLPNNATVSQLNFIFKDAASNSTRQSADMKGTNYGFTTTTIRTLSVTDAVAIKKKSVVADGKLFTAKTGEMAIQIIDFSGRIVKQMQVHATGSPIEVGLPQHGVFLMKIGNDEVIKFKN